MCPYLSVHKIKYMPFQLLCFTIPISSDRYENYNTFSMFPLKIQISSQKLNVSYPHRGSHLCSFQSQVIFLSSSCAHSIDIYSTVSNPHRNLTIYYYRTWVLNSASSLSRPCLPLRAATLSASASSSCSLQRKDGGYGRVGKQDTTTVGYLGREKRPIAPL